MALGSFRTSASVSSVCCVFFISLYGAHVYIHIFVHTMEVCNKPIIIIINSSPPSAAYMRPWTSSALVQIMACRLSGAKPLPEPMLPYCYLDPWEQNAVKFEFKQKITFSSWICVWNYRLRNDGHFVMWYLTTSKHNKVHTISVICRVYCQ